jgi:hypothetical protein
VSRNGWLLRRRGCSSPAHASGLDTHRDSINSRFDCSGSEGGGGGHGRAKDERGVFKGLLVRGEDSFGNFGRWSAPFPIPSAADREL